VEDWAEEAHKAAQKTVYGRLPKVAAGTPVPIGAACEKMAGARLAAVLNATLRCCAKIGWQAEAPNATYFSQNLESG